MEAVGEHAILCALFGTAPCSARTVVRGAMRSQAHRYCSTEAAHRGPEPFAHASCRVECSGSLPTSESPGPAREDFKVLSAFDSPLHGHLAR